MLQELADKYRMVLRFSKAENFDIDLLDSLLSLTDFEVNPRLKQQVVEIVKGLSIEKGYSNLFQVAKDPEFLSTVALLHKDMQELDISGEKLLKPKALPNGVGQKEMVNDMGIPIDSIIKCAHCQKAFSLADAPGLRDKVN